MYVKYSKKTEAFHVAFSCVYSLLVIVEGEPNRHAVFPTGHEEGVTVLDIRYALSLTLCVQWMKVF